MGNLPDKEVKLMTLKMFKELGRRLDEQSKKLEFFNKDLENIKKNQTEVKNRISEIRNTLERIRLRWDICSQEQISELETQQWKSLKLNREEKQMRPV